uniref:Bile acid sodium symporter/ transporter n=1 Tax=Arundo donax TaxID=35708 RepID=A0A0A9FZE8_ARUDO
MSPPLVRSCARSTPHRPSPPWLLYSSFPSALASSPTRPRPPPPVGRQGHGFPSPGACASRPSNATRRRGPPRLRLLPLRLRRGGTRRCPRRRGYTQPTSRPAPPSPSRGPRRSGGSSPWRRGPTPSRSASSCSPWASPFSSRTSSPSSATGPSPYCSDVPLSTP